MRIKKKSVARLASLSALGAGALGVAAGTAQASIVHPGLTPVTVGPEGNSYARVALQGSAGFSVKSGGHAASYRWSVDFWGGSGTRFLKRATRSAFLSVVGSGRKWGSPATSLTGQLVGLAKRTRTGSVSHTWGNPAFSDQYVLFKFQSGGDTLYGWLELSNAMSTGYGPNVTLEDMAYDTSGHQIAAGDTGIPEPSTMALTGLAALALGASGLRRWRAARKPAA